MELQNVKGHVTEEMMETGKYDRKEREGNDNSDVAEGKGSSISQELTQTNVAMYEWRQKGYRNTMARIKQFIVKLKMLHNKELMEDKANKEDPFETKENKQHCNTPKA